VTQPSLDCLPGLRDETALTVEIDPIHDSRLLGVLFTSYLQQSVDVLEVRRSPIGNGQETWFVETSVGRFVVRRSAKGGPLTWTSRSMEFEVLESLQSIGLPIPRVLWHEPEGGSLGRAYLVMEALPGKPPGRSFDGAMARELGRVLAQLHHKTRRDSHMVGHGHLAGILTATSVRFKHTLFRTEPLATELLQWAESHIPETTARAVRLWGDPGPHNMLVADGRVTGLLDWEMTSLGHPGEDIGAALWSVLGFADPLEVLNGYAESGSVPSEAEVCWFHVVAQLVRAGQALEGTRAFLEAESDEVTLPAMGLGLVTANLLRAASAAWGLHGEASTVVTGQHNAPVEPYTQRMLQRLRAVQTSLSVSQDSRTTTRRRIIEVVIAAYSAGAANRMQSVEGGVISRAELIQEVLTRRDRMRDLLVYFGPTTSTSVAK